VKSGQEVGTLFLLAASLTGTFCAGFADTVQDRGLPGAVRTEVVFPFVAWGRIEGFFHVTELILVNTGDQDLRFELQLFNSDGTLARDYLASQETVGTSAFLMEDGMLRGFVAANSVLSWNLEPWWGSGEGFFQGWVLLRSDRELAAHLRYTVLELRERLEVASIMDLPGNFRSVKRAEYAVRSIRLKGFSDYPGEDGRLQQVWKTEKSGVALVNPGETPLAVELRLRIGEEQEVRSLQLPPKTQRTFIVSDFFGSIPKEPSNYRGRLEITSLGDEFAATAVDLEMFTTLDGAFCSEALCRIPYWYRQPVGIGFEWGSPFQFPEEILEHERIGAFDAYLTRFGLVLVTAGGVVQGVYAFDYGAQGQFQQTAYGFGFVTGRDHTPIIFGDTGKVVIASEAAFSGVVDVHPGEIEGQVILSQTIGCYGRTVVIDIVRQEVVSVTKNPCF